MMAPWPIYQRCDVPLPSQSFEGTVEVASCKNHLDIVYLTIYYPMQ